MDEFIPSHLIVYYIGSILGNIAKNGVSNADSCHVDHPVKSESIIQTTKEEKNEKVLVHHHCRHASDGIVGHRGGNRPRQEVLPQKASLLRGKSGVLQGQSGMLRETRLLQRGCGMLQGRREVLRKACLLPEEGRS